MVKLITAEDAGHWKNKASAPDEFLGSAIQNEPSPTPIVTPPTLVEHQDPNNEVLIEVGADEQARVFPARRDILQSRCPKLAHRLEGKTYLVLRNVDPNAFEQLLRFLNNQPVSLKTVSSTLQVLEASRLYLVLGLVKHCIIRLDLMLDRTNVLAVYRYLHPFCSVAIRGNEPSAPPLEDDSSDSRLRQLYAALYENCLLTIDQNAYSILMSDDVEALSYEELLDIISRDTFYIKSEILVYEALMRWVKVKCREMNLDLNPKPMKYVMGDLRYAVRYGLLSKDDFYKRVERLQILEDDDCEQIWAFLRKKNTSLPKKMGTHRKKNVTKLRRICSSTNLKSHREQPDNISTRSERKISFGQKCIINCLSIWMALFD